MEELIGKKPKRVLSAYNFFFQDQRSKILSGEADDCSVEDDNAVQESSCVERNGSDSEDVLKSTGPRKVGFKSLGKSVGRRWRRLAPEDRIEFEKAAAADKERYAKEMAAYKEECKAAQALKRKQAQLEKKEKKQKTKDVQNISKKTPTSRKIQAPVPKVIPRSAEHRSETISSQIEPSFTHCSIENSSVYSRDGAGNTGHHSSQFPHYSSQRNDYHPYWYGHPAAESHHGGGHYSTGMPYYSAAPPPYSSYPTRYDPGYAASHSEEIANSYPNDEAERHGNLSVSSNQSLPMYGNTFPYPQQTLYPPYSNAPLGAPHYEIPPEQQGFWAASSYPHTEQSRYVQTSWNNSNDNENKQNSYNPREAQHTPGDTNLSNNGSV